MARIALPLDRLNIFITFVVIIGSQRRKCPAVVSFARRYFHEYLPDTCERLFETPSLEWLRHVRCFSQLLALWAFGERHLCALTDGSALFGRG